MSDQELYDPKLKALMNDSRLEMPFSDFEARVMDRIHKSEQKKKSLFKDIRLSWLFFTVGALFGILATFVMPVIKKSIYGIDVQFIQYPLMLLASIIIVWQLDAMIRLTVRQRQQRKQGQS